MQIFGGSSKWALTCGTLSVNTRKTSSYMYVFGSWTMNRQIDHHKSNYEVSFYPGSRLTLHSAHVRWIQPCK